MEYVDPRVLDKVAAPGIRFDPDEDFLILVGIVPHTPEIYDGERCQSCGYLRGDRIARSTTRRGRVVCSNCCRGSLDGLVNYPGLKVDERPNEDWESANADEWVEEPKPKYQPGPLKGGRGSRKKGVAK